MHPRLRILFALLFISSAFQAQNKPESLLKNGSQQWLGQALKTELPQVFEHAVCPTFKPETFKNNKSSKIDIGLELSQEAQQNLWTDLSAQQCQVLFQLKALSDLYFPLFEKKIQAHGLSDDYKFLPLMLSGLDAGYSGAYNKSGLWQIDFAVAKRAGLRIDDLIDERNLADVSTDVALTHLKILESRYPNDPIAVLTAYCSSIGVLEKINPEKKLSGKTLYDKLPAENKKHIDQYYGLMRVFKNLEAENHLLDYLKILQQYESVSFTQMVTFSSLSKVLGVAKKDLQGPNPTFIGEQIPANYQQVAFVIPANKVALYQQLQDSIYRYSRFLAAAPAKVAAPQHNGQTQIHTVRSGDVLSSIARTYGVGVDEIKAWNNLGSDAIQIGQKLEIYSATQKEAEPSENTSAKKTSHLYTVQAGDNLWSIAKKYPGVKAEQIMEWNQIDENLQPGQVLSIYLND